MRILGSGKIDDFQKIVLSDKVVKALNVKSGDSILFYRGGDDRVEMFKAEGAHVTDEFDSSPRIHMRGLRSLLNTLLLVSIVLIVISAVLTYGSEHITAELDENFLNNLAIVTLVVAVALMVAMLVSVRLMDNNGPTERLITVGGPYTKDRLIGLTKLMSDGRIVSGSLYLNSLFGSNPESVAARIDYDDGRSDIALTKCVKSVPGYSVHKVRFQSEKLSCGSMTLDLVYRYSDKLITVRATYGLHVNNPESMMIKVKECDISAELHFDDHFQRSTFDESIFDPTDDDMVI